MRVPKFRLFLVVVLGAALLAGWTGALTVPVRDVFESGEQVSDTSVVDRYAAEFDLAGDGVLNVTETLDVAFTVLGKHGIYRIFDTRDAQYPSIEHPVEVESVQRRDDSGWVDEPWIVSQEGGGTMTVRVGSEARTYPIGVQRYRIVSRTTNAITPPSDGPENAQSQWYWDVVGSGWAMPMRQVRIEASMPPTVSAPLCEAAVPCDLRPTDRGLTVTADSVPAYTPLTVKAFFAEPAPAVARSAFQMAFLLGAVVLATLTVALTLWTFARSRERKPAPRLTFQPPGPDPLVCAWTLQEKPVPAGVPAVLLNLVAHKVVDFEYEQRSTDDDEGPDWIRLTRTQQPLPDLVGFPETLQGLGITRPGSSATISKDSVEDGKKLSALSGELGGLTQRRALTHGLAVRVGGSGTALFLTLVCIVAAGAALIWLVNGLTIATILFVPAVVGLAITSRDTTRLTGSGSTVQDATAGFEEVLSTPASTERFDYAARVRHFDEYLPWAVAFGCAREWAESCTPPAGERTETWYRDVGVHAPGRSRLWALSTGVVAVEAAAVAAYQATQRSSSGGGGGGGGGGSGGGGGGSW